MLKTPYLFKKYHPKEFQEKSKGVKIEHFASQTINEKFCKNIDY